MFQKEYISHNIDNKFNEYKLRYITQNYVNIYVNHRPRWVIYFEPKGGKSCRTDRCYIFYYL
jgi:hypothetical protein